MPLSSLGLNRDNWCPCYFTATQPLWPLTTVAVIGKGHFVVVFFSVIMSAFANSLISSSLTCNV